ncbi:hypothetical protein BC832DRAFT_46068 [Gaertneriomyces semiglobifer]|nr:hypothetical protein BC832DRAFT_46068 [Gaertneriomyces semiglobifer]
MPKIIFYDFDNTLCLWKLAPAAKSQYESYVRDLLRRQGEQGIIRVIISTSTSLLGDIDTLQIASLIDGAFSVTYPMDKVATIVKVLTERALSPDDAWYFDDDFDCVEEARRCGIRSICVSPRQGILPHFKQGS